MSFALWSLPIWIIGIGGMVWALCIFIIKHEREQKRWISLLDNETVVILGTVALMYFYFLLTS